jgi:hypothetical protein
LMSWQGQFGDLIESLEFYETDEKRGFVRGAAGAWRPPAVPSTLRCRRVPASRSGGRTTICTSRKCWATARTGAVRGRPARRGQPHTPVIDGDRRRRHRGP